MEREELRVPTSQWQYLLGEKLERERGRERETETERERQREILVQIEASMAL